MARQPKTEALSIWIGLPPRVLHPNARTHWAAKARAVKRYRLDCRLSAMASLPPDRTGFPWPVARVKADFYFSTVRQRDEDNLLASLKAAFDGLQDAGIVANDCTIRACVGQVVSARPDRRPGVLLHVTREQ